MQPRERAEEPGSSGARRSGEVRRRRRGAPPPRSAYATGGGGVVLEHDHGAWLLGHLLLGDPLPGLGEEFFVTEVAFQAHRLSRVDDAVVTGAAETGDSRSLALGVRRDPVIGPSDDEFVRLWAAFVATTSANWERIASGTLRTGLVVAGPHRATQELTALANTARAQDSPEAFRGAVAVGAAGQATRLRLVDELTVQAIASLGDEGAVIDAATVAWRVLTSLYPYESFLEGQTARDRATMIGRLAAISASGDGLGLWNALVTRAREYIPAGATVDQSTLRRDLVGVVGVLRDPRFAHAWTALDELSRLAATQVHQEVTYGGRTSAIDRADLRARARQAMSESGLLVVTGEADAGKSALVAAAADDLTAQGGAVLTLNLRDLPASAGEFVALLGASSAQVLAGFAVAPSRVLVIDGAEAVQEAHRGTLTVLVAAATSSRINVTVVARDDASGLLRQALADAAGLGAEEVQQLVVPQLTQLEVDELLAAIPELALIGADPRSSWLLARPGLVDILLRADALRSLPDGAVAEADIHAAVWSDLVRNREGTLPNGATPDGRENALLGLARSRLGHAGIPPGDGASLASLRSDGLLRTRPANAPWLADDFSRDLVRDLAVAALLDRDGLDLLADAGAPRWAARAAKLVVQARLLRAANSEATRIEIQAIFDGLAHDHGERWLDLPWEALLGPRLLNAMAAAWPALIADRAAALRRVIRIVRQRYAKLGAIDPLAGSPLAGMLLEHVADWPGIRPAREDGESFVSEWLAGLVRRGDADQPDDRRQAARHLLLDGELLHDLKDRMTALATLGLDLDDPAVDVLRRTARERPHSLQDAVEDIDARLSLARHRPDLLLELAEAYYIEPLDEDRFGFRNPVLDRGVRDHRFHGLGMPMAAAYYGPFRELLQVRPRETISFLNRLLDHAAEVRVAGSEYLDESLRRPSTARSVELEIGGQPPRAYVGDSHVWGWYRGNTVGPYPAISALMALEDWADNMIRIGIPVRKLVEILLEGAHNLAMAGLGYGILARHLDAVTDELDGYLRSPVVWHLEFNRALAEGHLLTRKDDDARTGAGRRSHTPRDIAMQLVLRAASGNDRKRLDELAAVGRDLVGSVEATGDPETIAVVRQWAAGLDPTTYEFTPAGTNIEIRVVPPPEAAEVLAEQNADLQRGQQGWRLWMAYAGIAEPDLAQLPEAIEIARAYWEEPPASGPSEPAGPPAAVAMALLRAHAQGSFQASPEQISWAIDVLVEITTASPDASEIDFGGSLFDIGADRSAGRGLAATLAPAFHEDGTDALRSASSDLRVEKALGRALISPTDEVRRLTAQALRPVWTSPCGEVFAGRCRHEVAFQLALESIRYARLGPWDGGGRRGPLPLEDPIPETLRIVVAGDLALDWLPSAVLVAADAASSETCQAERARNVLAVLLEVQRRVLPDYLEHRYSREDHDREPFVVAMFQEAAAGRSQPLTAWLADLGTNSEAVEELLGDAARVATYDPVFRRAYATVWTSAVDRLLDLLEAGQLVHERAYLDHDAAAAVMPAPQIRIADTTIDATLTAAGNGWVDLETARPRIERWLPQAAGCPRCADALVGFLRTLPSEVQADEGLTYLRQVIEGHADSIDRRSHLVSAWLKDLDQAGNVTGPLRSTYQVVVDTLAAAGDRIAAELQAREE